MQRPGQPADGQHRDAEHGQQQHRQRQQQAPGQAGRLLRDMGVEGHPVAIGQAHLGQEEDAAHHHLAHGQPRQLVVEHRFVALRNEARPPGGAGFAHGDANFPVVAQRRAQHRREQAQMRAAGNHAGRREGRFLQRNHLRRNVQHGDDALPLRHPQRIEQFDHFRDALPGLQPGRPEQHAVALGEVDVGAE